MSYLLQDNFGGGAVILVVIGLILFFVALFVATRFKRCPSNKILVVYGKVGTGRSARCIHGGGAFILPLIQDYDYLDLVPRPIEIDLIGALSKKNIRVNVPSTFTVGISTQAAIMQNAAERLLGLSDQGIRNQSQDIILGQMRLVIATLSIEEINQDREKFLELVNLNVGSELQKIGLEVINVNIRDITDESHYIEAIGKKAAAEAVNQARIEVAEAEQMGAVGEAQAVRTREVRVAEETSSSMQGQKKAQRDQDVAVAAFEAESVQGQKQAERDQRIAVASFEADAVGGENTSKAQIATVNADLAEKEATARRRADVASANALRDILLAEKERELAKLAKEQVAQEEIERQKIEIAAEAEAEQIRRVARGEADRILAIKTAEAEGQRAILDAKAEGYRNRVAACGDEPGMVPTLLMIEKVTEVVAEQVKAIQNLQIDKITVWDSGSGGGGTGGGTAGFLSGLMGSLPPMHELARQAGIELPSYLGHVKEAEVGGDSKAEGSDKEASA